MLRLVRIMQAAAALGILQTLVTGLPSASAFARIFQFGMRLGMRSYTLGAPGGRAIADRTGATTRSCGWRPFMEHCRLPVLPGTPPLGGHVLSHDQLEAVLMRRAGYEVRVLPEEDGSWEENPPSLLEFIRRDLRWCQGNMQYFHFLTMPGLLPISRCQLALAIPMFIGSPAWIAMLLVGSAAAALAPSAGRFHARRCRARDAALVLAMWFAPNIATMIDVVLRRDLRRAFGGGLRFGASVLLTIVFVTLLAPIMWLSHTLFLVRLLFGRTVAWTAQARDDHRLPWMLALRQFFRTPSSGLRRCCCWRRPRLRRCRGHCSLRSVRWSRSRSRLRLPRPRSAAPSLRPARPAARRDRTAARIARPRTARDRIGEALPLPACGERVGVRGAAGYGATRRTRPTNDALVSQELRLLANAARRGAVAAHVLRRRYPPDRNGCALPAVRGAG